MKAIMWSLWIAIAGLTAWLVNNALPDLAPDNPYSDTSTASGPAKAVDWTSAGGVLFKANCSRCHMLNKPFTGPALYKVQERIPGGDWIYQWVHNSAALIKSGNPYANKIHAEYNKVEMDPFPNLTEAEIDQIMEFIASYEPAVASK